MSELIGQIVLVAVAIDFMLFITGCKSVIGWIFDKIGW